MQSPSKQTRARRAVKIPQTVGVLIATFQRPDDLARCLDSLLLQTLVPLEILVTARADDFATLELLADFGSRTPVIRTVTVTAPGTVAARNAGLDALQADIVVMIDDDTIVLEGFLSTVLTAFQADPALGGLGGRDRCYGSEGFDDEQEAEVGKLRWYGKMVGNHHRGYGEIREVDLLKGANMSYRAEAVADVRFNERLRGSGAQPSEDYCFSVAVKNRGWKLAYDPAALIHHFASQRVETRHYVGVQRLTEYDAFRNYSYNQAICTWTALGRWQSVAFLAWSTLVGTGTFPGLVQAIRLMPRIGVDSWYRFTAAQLGKFEAARDLIFSRKRQHA